MDLITPGRYRDLIDSSHMELAEIPKRFTGVLNVANHIHQPASYAYKHQLATIQHKRLTATQHQNRTPVVHHPHPTYISTNAPLSLRKLHKETVRRQRFLDERRKQNEEEEARRRETTLRERRLHQLEQCKAIRYRVHRSRSHRPVGPAIPSRDGSDCVSSSDKPAEIRQPLQRLEPTHTHSNLGTHRPSFGSMRKLTPVQPTANPVFKEMTTQNWVPLNRKDDPKPVANESEKSASSTTTDRLPEMVSSKPMIRTMREYPYDIGELVTNNKARSGLLQPIRDYSQSSWGYGSGLEAQATAAAQSDQKSIWSEPPVRSARYRCLQDQAEAELLDNLGNLDQKLAELRIRKSIAFMSLKDTPYSGDRNDGDGGGDMTHIQGGSDQATIFPDIRPRKRWRMHPLIPQLIRSRAPGTRRIRGR